MRTLKESLVADGLRDMEGVDLTPYVQQVLPRQRGHYWGGAWQTSTMGYGRHGVATGACQGPPLVGHAGVRRGQIAA